MIDLFTFFSGCGLLDLGFETEGYNIVYVNEYHEPFLEAYKHSRSKLNISPPKYGYHLGDIKDFLEENGEKSLESLISKSRKEDKVIGFIGGPPCPDFSVAGKNKGKCGDNGILSLEYIKLICQEKPDFFLFENVKGLWRTKKHKEFYEELKEQLRSSGYILTDRLVNAIEYAVPQVRERIILFGVKSDFAKKRKLPIDETNMKIPEDCFPWEDYMTYPKDEAVKLSWPSTSPFEENSRLDMPDDIPIELTVQHWFEKNEVEKHPNSAHFFKPRGGLPRFLSVDEGDDSRKSFKRLHRWRYSPTAAYGNNEVHLHPYKARRLTVAESLAIQSLPKEFELPEGMSLTNMFKTIGNGVPFLASKMIAKTIKYYIESEQDESYSFRFSSCDR